ncbi:MAG: type III-B CRISPR module RAMP protein Cmr1 [Gammaproteobacteria bacterium]
MTEPVHTFTAKYRVVTPMFLSGADPNQAEFRLPSFKGALRFWWRAMAAQQFDSVQALRNEEDRLFGSTRTGVSHVRMRLAESRFHTKNQQKFNRNSWQSYVGYGLIDKPGQTERVYIQPGGWFTVQLSCPGCDAKQRDSLCQMLIVLGLFGGLGSRTRNGWGSLTLETLTGNGEPWRAPTDEPSLKKATDGLLVSGCGLKDWTAFTKQSGCLIGKPCENSEKAHCWLAENYRKAIRNLSDKGQREGFGLPRKNAGGNARKRRAGAVFLHVHQPEGAQAIPLALFLPGKFLSGQYEPSGTWRIARTFVDAGART